MSDFEKDTRTPDRRLSILRLLLHEPNYRLNILVMRRALVAHAHACSIDQLAEDASWLEAQGLLTIGAVGSLLILNLTLKGKDVALGYSRCPGVQRPEPDLV